MQAMRSTRSSMVVGYSCRSKRAAAGDAGSICATTNQPADECRICGDDFSKMQPGTVVSRLTCGHLFCAKCIEQWFQAAAQNSCPTCRRIYSGLRSAKMTTAETVATGQVAGAALQPKRQKKQRQQAQHKVSSGSNIVAEKQNEWMKKAAKSRRHSSALSIRTGISGLVFLQRECEARGLVPSGGKI